MAMDIHIQGKFQDVRFHHDRTEIPDAGEFERHCHPNFELLLLLQGRGKFVVEGAEYPLQEGMVMLLRPYEYHYVQPERDCPYERVVVGFRAESPLGAARELGILRRADGEMGLCFLPEKTPKGILEALCSLDVCPQLEADGGEDMTRAVLTQVLLLLGLSSPVGDAEEDPLTAKVMAYLSEHLQQELHLEELARQFFVSKFHLCRAFRKHAGVTVLDYLTQKRVATAQSLLRQGVGAAEAARQTGFSDYSTFYRAYRKYTGKSPTWERRKT